MVLPNLPTGIRLTEGKLKTLIQDEDVRGVVLSVDSLANNPQVEVDRDFILYLDQVATEGYAHLSLKGDAPKAYRLSDVGVVIVNNRDREGNPVEDWSIRRGHRFEEVRAVGVHKRATGLKRFFSKGTYHPIVEEGVGDK